MLNTEKEEEEDEEKTKQDEDEDEGALTRGARTVARTGLTAE
jgi:hypothetical protein